MCNSPSYPSDPIHSPHFTTFPSSSHFAMYGRPYLFSLYDSVSIIMLSPVNSSHPRGRIRNRHGVVHAHDAPFKIAKVISLDIRQERWYLLRQERFANSLAPSLQQNSPVGRQEFAWCQPIRDLLVVLMVTPELHLEHIGEVATCRVRLYFHHEVISYLASKNLPMNAFTGRSPQSMLNASS